MLLLLLEKGSKKMQDRNKVIDQVFYLSEILDKKVTMVSGSKKISKEKKDNSFANNQLTISKSKKIGKLSDVLISESMKLPEVVSLVVARSFGRPALYIPWSKVKEINNEEVRIDIDFKNITNYETSGAGNIGNIKGNEITTTSSAPSAGTPLVAGGSGQELFFLKDQVLDKKVLDIEDNEVEVVYDVVLAVINGKMYVSEVDCSRYGLLRRIGLKKIVQMIHKIQSKIREQTVSWSYIQPLPKNIDRFSGNVKLKVLKEKLNDMPPVDLADVLEEMDHEQRVALFNQLDIEQASDTLEEIDPNVQRELIPSLKKEKVVELLEDMTPGQVADVLSVLPSIQVKSILELLDTELASKVAGILEKQEENVLNLATSKYISVRPQMRVGDIEKNFRNLAQDCDVLMYLYVLDEKQKLQGIVDIKEILQAPEDSTLEEIMTTNIVSLTPTDTLKIAYDTFNRYGLRAIPITDEENKILGVIPYRDVVTLKHRFI